jgi:mono/diheme cytochrome c family protein
MRKILLGMLVLMLVSCGDPATGDERGYTKAPLETPGLLVAGEPQSAVQVKDTPEPGLTGPDPAEVESPASDESASQDSSSAQVTLAAGVTQAEYDEGDKLFHGAGGCTACHGQNAKGSQLAPDLTDDTWLHVSGPNVDEIAQVIQNGVPQPVEHPAPMPPMGGANLTSDQVKALASYVASLSAG